MHYTLQKNLCVSIKWRKKNAFVTARQRFIRSFCTSHLQGNNKFGKWHDPITKTEFTLAIFSSSFYKQEEMDFNCFTISKKKTIRDVFSDVTHQDGDSSVYSAYWKLFNGGTLADGYTIFLLQSKCSLKRIMQSGRHCSKISRHPFTQRSHL